MSVIQRQDIDRIAKLLEEMQEDGSLDGFAAILIGYAPSGECQMIMAGEGVLSEKRLIEGFGRGCRELVEQMKRQGAPRVPDGKEGTPWN